MLNITNIPSARVQLIDPNTDLISTAWYRFFLNMFELTGGGSSGITNYREPPSPIIVDASPFVYVNNTGFPADIIVSGGGVILLEFSRNGVTFFNTGSFYGMFTLSPFDRLRVTYQTPPQLTLVPR
jgi:hypothetical protein